MADYPKINGVAPDWSSVEIDLGDAGIVTGITELTYGNTLEPGVVRGTSPQKLARTRGEHDAEGSITMNLEDANDFIQKLGDGYLEAVFNITVNIRAPGATTVYTDRLIGCRMKGDEGGGSQGADPLQVTFPLDVMYVEKFGKKPLNDMLV